MNRTTNHEFAIVTCTHSAPSSAVFPHSISISAFTPTLKLADERTASNSRKSVSVTARCISVLYVRLHVGCFQRLKPVKTLAAIFSLACARFPFHPTFKRLLCYVRPSGMTEDSNECVGNMCPASERNPGTTTSHRIVTKKNEDKTESITQKEVEDEEFVPQIRWPDTIVQLFLHLGCVYGLFLCLVSAKFYTTLFAFLTIYITGFGITAGAHRLWSHRAYKAKWPLRLLLVTLFTVTGQRHVYAWALDHRVHHKYSETDADPHNAKRGFFFSHVGWLILTPHPNVVEKRESVDMSDLEADSIVMWQKKLYPPLFAIFNVILPVAIPVYYWDETIWNSFWINFNTRFTITLNIAFFVNSVAHMWGQKPYDKYISPVENLAVSLAALGEGWHNYHHVFPWDYKTGELGNAYNPSTTFIDFFAKLGWAYDLKSVSRTMIARRAKKSGDGSHPQIWGYGDTDIEKEDLEELESMGKEKELMEGDE